jgi:hypothetical protein
MPRLYRDVKCGGVSIRGCGGTSKDVADRAERSRRANPVALTERELTQAANVLLYGERTPSTATRRKIDKPQPAVPNRNGFVWVPTVYTVAPPKR